MKDEGFRILGYVVVMYIIALLPIRRVLGITLLFVACSVFILLEKGGLLMWIDIDDLRSDIQTKITKIEGRGRTLNATEVGKIMGLQMVQTMLDEFEEAYYKEAKEHYERLMEEK